MRKSPTQCSGWKNWKRVSGVLCYSLTEGESVQDSGRPALIHWRRHININWSLQKCEYYHGCAELQSFTVYEMKE